MSLRSLSILAGAGALEPLPAEVMAALERVEIVSALGERGTFRLGFRLDSCSSLPSRFLSASGDLVRVVLSTEEGGEHVVAMDGILVTHSVSTGGPEPGLVLGGEDLTVLMDLLDGSGRPFPGMPVAARVAVLLAAYSSRGVIPQIVPPPLTAVPDPGARIDHQQGTDYAYLRSLARSIGYRFTLDPGPAPGSSVSYWGPEPRGDRSHPVLVIPFGQPGNVATLQLSFDAFQRVAPEAAILDPASKAILPIPAPQPSALGAPLGAVVPPAHRHRRLHGTAKLTAAETASTLLAEAARSAEATTGRGTLNVGHGERRLRPGDLVLVRGATDLLDGLYTVRRVHDTLTAHHHHQRFELVRTGLGQVEGD